jgi:TolB-like protein/Flp pilus assembly protein TadD
LSPEIGARCLLTGNWSERTMNERPLGRFVRQLKQRKVIRVAIVYILVAWVVMQVGEVTFEALTLPSWALTLLIVLILLGFPIALVLAWVFEITAEGIRKDSVSDSAEVSDGGPQPETAERSIAVLPFNDLSEKGDQVYFCEGIAEEILNALCKIGNLRVAARITAFQLGREQADVRTIGDKLNVRAVMQGSVRKSGDMLRITVELVNTADGYHLWARQYDRRLEDIFDIQEEIANSIAGALSVTLKQKSFSERQPVDPKAYDFFLRGQSFFARQTSECNRQARNMFRQALEIEPEFGRAWAGLAYTYGFEYMYFNASDVNREEALRTSRKALALAPDLAESHVAAGMAHCMIREFRRSEAEFETAAELDPQNFDAWYFAGRAKIHQGEIKRALELFQTAAGVRPEDYQSVLLQAQLYNSLGDEKAAREVSRQGVERARAVLELNPDDNRALNMGAFGLLRIGEIEEGEKWMKASLEHAPKDAIVHYNAACLYALAGKVEEALDCLENCQRNVGNLNRDWLEHDSDMDSLRQNPRFAKIIASTPH